MRDLSPKCIQIPQLAPLKTSDDQNQQVSVGKGQPCLTSLAKICPLHISDKQHLRSLQHHELSASSSSSPYTCGRPSQLSKAVYRFSRHQQPHQPEPDKSRQRSARNTIFICQTCVLFSHKMVMLERMADKIVYRSAEC